MGIAGIFAGDALEPGAEFAVAEKQRAIGVAIAVDVGLGKAVPAHADHVEADQMAKRRSLHHAPRNDIGAHAAKPTIIAPSPMRTN